MQLNELIERRWNCLLILDAMLFDGARRQARQLRILHGINDFVQRCGRQQILKGFASIVLCIL